MKSKWTTIGILSAGLLLVLAVGLSQAQGPEPPEGGVQPQGEAGIAASVPCGIPIQGRLTDASGNPISGSRVVTYTLYDSLDRRLWSSGAQMLNIESNGLFNAVIPYCDPPTSVVINGQHLRLGIQVAGDSEMGPHQIIYAVPYAWSLRPGAVISDTSNFAILSVQNYGASTGVYGHSSSGSGVYGHSSSGNGVRGYSQSGVAIQADGTGVIQSAAVSRLFVPGGEAVLGGTDTTDVNLTYWARGTVEVDPSSNNITRTVVIPIPMPAVLYGQAVRIADIRVYYQTSNAASYIAETDLYREELDGGYYSLIEDKMSRSSTTFTYYHIYCTSDNCRLSADEGFISVRLQLYFANGAHNITLGGVRVTLEHD